MNCRYSHTAFLVPALVAWATLTLGGTSVAATLYGLAQPGWENDPDPGPSVYTNPISDGTSLNFYFIYNTWADSPYAISPELGTAFTESFILGEGAMGTSWGSPQKSSGAGVSSQWAQSDPQAAIAWLASISEQGNSEARDNALGSFIESFSGVPDRGAFPLEIDNTDRIFGDGRASRDLGSQWYGDSICSCWTLTRPGDFAVIPEPSTALLGAMGGFVLLRRRRTSCF